MPGNTVKINDSNALEFYVGDSHMGELMRWLGKNAIRMSTDGPTEEQTCTCGENEGCSHCTPQKRDPGEPVKVVVNMEDTLSKHGQLDRWIKQLTFPADKKTLIMELSGHGGPEEIYRSFCFFTRDHQYNIVAIDRKGEDGYLGCQVSTRKPRAGEDWNRGNDLPDGPFTRETWDNIIRAIVRYELVQLSVYQRPDNIPTEDEDDINF